MTTPFVLLRALQAVKHDVGVGTPVIEVRQSPQLPGGGCSITVIQQGRPYNVETLVQLTGEEFLAWRAEVQLLAQLEAFSKPRRLLPP